MRTSPNNASPKDFLLDTSVLLHDPESLFSFEENRLILVSPVIEELNKKKNDRNIGYAARQVLRTLDELVPGTIQRAEHPESEIDPKPVEVRLPKGGVLAIYYQEKDCESYADPYLLRFLDRHRDHVLISQDVALRVKAKLSGFRTEEYKRDRVNHLYTGFKELSVPDDVVDEFYRKGGITAPEGTFLNGLVQLSSSANEKKTALGIVKGKKLVALNPWPELSIKPRNREQQMIMSLLFDPDITMVSLTGPAGAGKTLFALLAGYTQTKDKYFDSLFITRASEELDKGHGFIPGDMNEKLAPWMGPFVDNMRLILKKKGEDYISQQKMYEMMTSDPQMEISALTFLRGRTLFRQFVIVDEVQNLTPHQVKTICTRIGTGSKLLLLGDPSDNQIDNPFLTTTSNGLAYVADRMKVDPHTAHLYLPKEERSDFASAASRLL